MHDSSRVSESVREHQMAKLGVCEGGVAFHRPMTKRKEEEKEDRRRVRSGTYERA